MQKINKVVLLIEYSSIYRQLLSGIAKYSRLYGPWMFYRKPLYYSKAKWRKVSLSQMKRWGASGAIAADVPIDEQTIADIISSGFPTIIKGVEGPIAGMPNIISDNVTIGEMAAEHLLDRGFQHFAYCGFYGLRWSQEREESFCRRICEAGFQTHVYQHPKSKSKRLWENEQGFLADWLKSLPKPVGLLACDDNRGEHALETCTASGLHVPEEIAIIGVDNDNLICDLTRPSLSSIARNFEMAGYAAAELLDRLMAGEKMPSQTVTVHPTHVVVRQSTDILAIENPEIAKAVHFIRQYANGPISVNDILNEVATSRRSLERGFNKILGRSIHDEIRRVRIEQVTRMLLETNLSISKIALALGYSSDTNMSRIFRKEKNMNPLAYRKKYGRI